MDGWMDGCIGRVVVGRARRAACLDWPNERGAVVWRAAPALSLSPWRRMPVISRPLSESILGIRATRASLERPMSLSVSPHFGFFPPSFVLFLCLIFPCIFSTIIGSHLSCWGLCLDLTVMSSLPNAWIALVRGTLIIHHACFFLNLELFMD